MADSYKMQVRLSEIVPGANPRRDFGDIDALAAAIEVTGGQPLNPPVVWPDGNVYRLADGERRVRALRRLHGDDGMADVLVYPSCDEAEEAVAMLATDAKQGLTDQERARGFQRMLQLGVDVDVAAKALRRKAADVRKAAKVASIAPEQATLDQMIAAAEFEDEDEQRAVLEAANWSAKAQSIVREHERREKNAPIEAELARLGVPVAESEPARRDYEYPRWIADPDSLLEWAEGRDLDGVLATRYQWGSGFYLWVPKGEDKEPEVSPEVLAERERQQRIASALEELERHLLMEVTTTDVMPHMAAVLGGMRDRLSGEHEWLMNKVAGLGTEEAIGMFLRCPASSYEIAMWIADSYLDWYEFAMAFLPPAIEDGYVPSEEDQWLLEQAVAKQAEIDAEGEGDDE